MIEYLERAPLSIGVTLQSILNMWLSVRTLMYLVVMLGLMGAQAIAYQLTMSSTSENFVSVSQAFFSLFSGGFFQQSFSYSSADARPMITILSLLWPINFLIFVSGYVAVLSDVWQREESEAQRAWRRGVVTQLQDALKWAEDPRIKKIRQRRPCSGLCDFFVRATACCCVLRPDGAIRADSTTISAEPLRAGSIDKAVGAAAAMKQSSRLGCACAKDFWPNLTSPLLRKSVADFITSARTGLPVLSLAVLYVLRQPIDIVHGVARLGRRFCCRPQRDISNAVGVGTSASPAAGGVTAAPSAASADRLMAHLAALDTERVHVAAVSAADSGNAQVSAHGARAYDGVRELEIVLSVVELLAAGGGQYDRLEREV